MGEPFGRPDLKAAWQNRGAVLKPALLSGALAAIGVVLFASLLVGAAHLAFGSLPAAIAYFRGERLSVEPAVVDVGIGDSGESREVTVMLTNWTDQPILVFGGSANCSCTVLGDLPVTIPAMESRKLSVEVRLTGSPGIFTRKAAFLVNDEGFKKLEFPITGQITGNTNRSY